jgi:pimeloyl-ACP methyl ester carboxylesterase
LNEREALVQGLAKSASGSYKVFVARSGILDRAHAHWLNLRGYERHHLSTSAGRVHALSAPGHGTGAPLLVLHGLASAASHYEGVLEAGRSFASRVIGIDLLGHGVSERPTQPTFEALEEALIESVDQLLDHGGKPAIVFGNSLGGAAAIRYATTRPSKVGGLFLVAPGGAPLSEEEREELLRRFALDTHGDALRFVDGLFDKPHAFRQVLAWGTRRRFGDRTVRALLAAHAADNFLSAEELVRLTMPVHLVWGEADRILPASHLSFFQVHLPEHAVIERVPHFGHVPHMDRPSDVIARLRAFATRAQSAAASGSLHTAAR